MINHDFMFPQPFGSSSDVIKLCMCASPFFIFDCVCFAFTLLALAAQAAQRTLERLQRLHTSKTRADKLLNDYRYDRVIDVLSHDPATLYQVDQ